LEIKSKTQVYSNLLKSAIKFKNLKQKEDILEIKFNNQFNSDKFKTQNLNFKFIIKKRF